MARMSDRFAEGIGGRIFDMRDGQEMVKVNVEGMNVKDANEVFQIVFDALQKRYGEAAPRDNRDVIR
jgi:hypothetical protein